MWKKCVVLFVLTFCFNEGNVQDGRVRDTKSAFGGVWGNRPPLMEAKLPRTTCTCKCGESNEESRIVPGVETKPNQYPWMAYLSILKKFYCGASLINDRYALTAAHCVKGYMWFLIKVNFAEHDRCNATQHLTRFVIRAIVNNFSYITYEIDIALLKLNERVPISEFIRPICLPSDDDDLYVGETAIATGWGATVEKGKLSCVLNSVTVPVLSNEECRATKYNASMITDNMLCAGYPKTGGMDACQADSGGPLIVERKKDKRYEIIGVVSWGYGCARVGYPGVYTRVTRVLKWIRENTEDGCYCTD